MKKIAIAWLLLLSLGLGLAGCGTDLPEAVDPTLSNSKTALQGGSIELLSNVVAQSVPSVEPDDSFANAMNQFSLSLLHNSYTEGENTILSPYSMYLALAMAANGAAGQTLEQMEALLGMPMETLNSYIHSLQNAGGKELFTANSLWIHKDLPVEEAYLQILKDYYDPQVFTTPFTDDTMEDMNHWINEATAGRIPNALDQMHPNAVMYLVNALTFDAAWKEIYTTDQVRPGEFHSPAGTLSVDMLHSEEHTYLEDDYATGFMKDYEGDQYSFFAMVPKDGTSVKEYLENLTAESLTNTIANAQQTTVFAAMPKFRGESSVEAAEVLKEMGMVDAFTAEADFSGIEAGKNLWIGRVLHKTYLQVDEAGTQAGAVTIEEFLTKGLALNAKSVTLDRPFVMGIYDKINGCFLFLGAVETPNQANA